MPADKDSSYQAGINLYSKVIILPWFEASKTMTATKREKERRKRGKKRKKE